MYDDAWVAQCYGPIWAMAVIIHHIYPSEFKSLSHMLKHSPLAEPRMQHTDDQVAQGTGQVAEQSHLECSLYAWIWQTL